MKIAVVFAMESEKEAFIKNANSRLNLDYYVSGIGKVNAARELTRILETNSYDYIINAGVAGGIKDVKLGEVYLGEYLTYSDFDLRLFDYKLGQVPGGPEKYEAETLDFILAADLGLEKRNILSQDSFAETKNLEMINQHFPDYNIIDMESTAFAQVANQYHQKLVILRGISDIVGQENQKETYEITLDKVMEKTRNIIEKLTNNLN